MEYPYEELLKVHLMWEFTYDTLYGKFGYKENKEVNYG